MLDRMHIVIASLVLVVALALGGGCAGTPRITGAAALPLDPETEREVRAEFPGAAGLLDSLEVASGTSQWRAGDRVLIGLTMAHGSDVQRRMLLVELGAEPGRRPRYRRLVDVFGEDLVIRSGTRAVRLGLYDEHGELITDRPGQLAEVFLDYGPVEVARIGGGFAIAAGDREEPRENPRDDITIEELTPSVYGMMSMLAFGDGASSNPTLARVIQRAFTIGQQMKLLWTMGRFEIRFGDVTALGPGDEPAPGLVLGGALVEGYDCQVKISVGETEALTGRAVVVPPHAPLGLGGGIVAARLVNSVDPTITAELVLLGASRGIDLVEPQSQEGSEPDLLTEERG